MTHAAAGDHRQGGAAAAHRVGRVVRPGGDLGPAHEGAAAEAAARARTVPDVGPSPNLPAASSAKVRANAVRKAVWPLGKARLSSPLMVRAARGLSRRVAPTVSPGPTRSSTAARGHGPQAGADTGREQQERTPGVAQEVRRVGDVPPGFPDPVRGRPDPGVRPPGPGVTGVPEAEPDDHESGEHGDNGKTPAHRHRQHRRGGHLAVRHRHRAAHPVQRPLLRLTDGGTGELAPAIAALTPPSRTG